MFEKNNKTVNAGTDWHQDLNMIPLDTRAGGYLTIWCPLFPLSRSRNDSLLVFAGGSHRDKSLTHWYTLLMHYDTNILHRYPQENVSKDHKMRILLDRYRFETVSNLNVGDCTAHHGWVYHYADKQPDSNYPRLELLECFKYVILAVEFL